MVSLATLLALAMLLLLFLRGVVLSGALGSHKGRSSRRTHITSWQEGQKNNMHVGEHNWNYSILQYSTVWHKEPSY